jgi:hypothetical protein
MFQRIRPHFMALAFYVALTAVALNNLIWHFATALPATEGWDYAIFYWNLWWVKYALFNLHRDPMFSNYVLYPYTVNFALHVHTLTLGLLTAPLQTILDLKVIFNGLIAGAFVASGYFTFLFLRRHIQSDWLALLGGALFTFTPMTIGRAVVGHVNELQVWWMPVHLLLWDGIVTKRGLRWRVLFAIGLGLALYLAWMTDSQMLLWGLPVLVPYALYTWLVQRRGRERLQVLGLAILAGVVMLGPALIEPIPALRQIRGIQFPTTDAYSLETFSYPLQWLVIRDPGRSGENMGQLVPLLTLLCLPLTGPRRQRWLWLAVGIGLFILALGAYWPGTHIPLPYLLIHKLMNEQYRTPMRFTTPASFALIVFITLSLADGFARQGRLRWQPWLVGAAVIGLVFDSGMLAAFPVKSLPDYRIYHEIGRDPAEYALLEVPVGPASGFGEFGDSPDLQYYAPIHHKQIINGIISRLPSDWLSRYERSPLFRGLTGKYDFPPLDTASRELADKLSRWNMHYVLVHRDRLRPERVRAIVEFLNIQPVLCVADEEGDLLAYQRINAWADCSHPEKSALPANTNRLVLGDSAGTRYVGPGWYDVEDIGGQMGRWAGEIATSTLRLVPPAGSNRFRFRAVTYPANQTVIVSVNDQWVGVARLTNDWAEYEFVLPADALRADGPITITLTHARLESAFERSGGTIDDKRPLAAAYDYFAFEPAR